MEENIIVNLFVPDALEQSIIGVQEFLLADVEGDPGHDLRVIIRRVHFIHQR